MQDMYPFGNRWKCVNKRHNEAVTTGPQLEEVEASALPKNYRDIDPFIYKQLPKDVQSVSPFG